MTLKIPKQILKIPSRPFNPGPRFNQPVLLPSLSTLKSTYIPAVTNALFYILKVFRFNRILVPTCPLNRPNNRYLASCLYRLFLYFFPLALNLLRYPSQTHPSQLTPFFSMFYFFIYTPLRLFLVRIIKLDCTIHIILSQP